MAGHWPDIAWAGSGGMQNHCFYNVLEILTVLFQIDEKRQDFAKRYIKVR